MIIVEVPRTTAEHPNRVISAFFPCSAIVRCAVVIIMPDILTPFLHIAAQVVEAEFVGGQLAYGLRFAF